MSDANIKSSNKVFLKSEVLQEIRVHARSYMYEEICGVLIGKNENEFTKVTARIAGIGAAQAGANVTFTQEAWENIYKVKDSQYPDESIVGWYHSHPGFGIFLSEYDLFIHDNFFAAKHQIAWVFDPHSDEEGCFGWINNEVKPLTEFTVIQKPPKENIFKTEHKKEDETNENNEIKKGNISLKGLGRFFSDHKRLIIVTAAILIIVDAAVIYKSKVSIMTVAHRSSSFIQESWNSIFSKKEKINER